MPASENDVKNAASKTEKLNTPVKKTTEASKTVTVNSPSKINKKLNTEEISQKEILLEKINNDDKVVSQSSESKDTADSEVSVKPHSANCETESMPPPSILGVVTELFSSPESVDGSTDQSTALPQTSSTESEALPDSNKSPFSRRITSPSPAMKYRLMCQCGAKNCRKYLF